MVGGNEDGTRGDCAQGCKISARQTARRDGETSAQEIARGIVGIGEDGGNEGESGWVFAGGETRRTGRRDFA